MTSNFQNSMYPRSFLRQEAKIIPERKNFIKSMRMQYGNPDSHAFFKFLLYFIFVPFGFSPNLTFRSI